MKKVNKLYNSLTIDSIFQKLNEIVEIISPDEETKDNFLQVAKHIRKKKFNAPLVGVAEYMRLIQGAIHFQKWPSMKTREEGSDSGQTSA